MAAPLRRAGHGRTTDGREVVWSVAEGRRGRRWREAVTALGGGVESSLLLEVGPDGRFSHLELSTSAGLLTLHPEGDGTLHGNAVTPAGIRHVRGWPWDAEAVVLVDGSAVCRAVATSCPGTPRARPALVIGLDLALERRASDVDPNAATSDGLPALIDATAWPLEDQTGPDLDA